MANVVKKIQEGGQIFNALMVIGFLGIVWLMIYGNLSGNLGFATGSTGSNNTDLVINNLTEGTTTFFGFSGTLFTIVAIVILITMLVGLLYLVISIMKSSSKNSSGYA